ncbi:DUF1016 N-terminal domain-containing protein [Chryseobacterium soli]
MEISEDSLYQSVKEIVTQSREKVFRMANSTLLLTYWQIGQLIVEDEQKGDERATYGSYTLKNLSKKLTLEFGKGFDESNLRNMRSFYQAFPICDALRHELSWTHYRLLIKLDNSDKMNYYINESIQNNWNYRDLKRQINSLVFKNRGTFSSGYRSN